jgi:hypothetical protein
MSGQRFVYDSERQRHERFVGRAELLARLDRLLVDRGADYWVVVTGGPGMGKSAILTTWLARRETAGAAVPHHFIRRGAYDWDDPSQLVSSLVAQLEERFELREPEADERLHPAARLHRMLSRASSHQLAPRNERLVVVIDGLDEYDPPAAAAGDPLAAFLPHALPAGVSVLCASRPRHPYVASLAARDGEFVQIDLDEPASAADNGATVRAFWDREAGPLGFNPRVRDDARFLDEAVARAAGNLQHAVQLRKQLAALSAEQRRAARDRIEDIPRGLAALIARSWERVAVEPIVVAGLGSCVRRARRCRSTNSRRWPGGPAIRPGGPSSGVHESCLSRPHGPTGRASSGCTTSTSATRTSSTAHASATAAPRSRRCSASPAVERLERRRDRRAARAGSNWGAPHLAEWRPRRIVVPPAQRRGLRVVGRRAR